MDRMFVVVLVLSLLYLTEGRKTHKKLKPHHEKKIARMDPALEQVESLYGPFEGYLDFKGCYPTPSTFFKERTDSHNNNNECAKFCSEIGKSIIGTSGTKCYCLDKLPTMDPWKPEVCSMLCPDSETTGSCSGKSCCGGDNKASVYNVTSSGGQSVGTKRSTGSLTIQGCFDDTIANVLTAERTVNREDSENTVLRCNEFCLDKGFPVCSLRSSFCYCTNVLPLDRLYEGVDGSRECNLFCSGVYAPSGQCDKDKCCGGQDPDGQNTYTVYINGNLDVLKQIIRRIESNTVNDPQLLEATVLGSSLCPEGWSRHGSSCIKYSTTVRNYLEAKNDCEGQNAHLMMIKDSEEGMSWLAKVSQLPSRDQQQDFSQPTENYNFKNLWIGMQYNQERDAMEWVNTAPTTPWHVNTWSATDLPTACSVATLVFGNPQVLNTIFFTVRNDWCSWRTTYYCQSYAKIVASARNPTSGTGGSETFQTYSMELAFPDILVEKRSLPEVADTERTLTLSVVNFEEKIRKVQSPSSNFLADSDVLFRNRNSSTEVKFIYSYSAETSSATTVTKSSGTSVAVSVGFSFSTSYFGLAEFAFSAGLEVTGNWENSRKTYTSETITHAYTFEFPIPAQCDATIAIMQNEIPTSIDWRASFYASGWVHVEAVGISRSVDVGRILSSSQQYLYSFGTNDFGNRPTIVPVQTLDCEAAVAPAAPETLEQCTNPDTEESEVCRVPLTLPATSQKRHKQG